MKRGLEPQDSFGSSQRPPSFLSSSSQNSAYTTSSENPEQPSYSDRGWKSIFPELIGFELTDDNNLSLEQDSYEGTASSLGPAESNGADLESWMTTELNYDFQLSECETSNAALVHDHSRKDDLICYGMVSPVQEELCTSSPQ